MSNAASGYVTIQPHSNSNDSSDYLVVHSTDWAKYVNGAVTALAIAGRFKTFKEADERKDRLNREAATTK